MDLALNNLQRLICHKTKQTKPINQQCWIQDCFREEISVANVLEYDSEVSEFEIQSSCYVHFLN